MRIFDEKKQIELNNVDESKGYLVNDVLETKIEAQPEQLEKSHYEFIKEYPSGGKEYKKVIDVPYKGAIPEHIKTENILVYKLYTKNQLEEIELSNIREKREIECFSIINRGQLWYNSLTSAQINELNTWYLEWLDAPSTKKIPTKPTWIK